MPKNKTRVPEFEMIMTINDARLLSISYTHRIFFSDLNQHILTRSIETDTLQ